MRVSIEKGTRAEVERAEKERAEGGRAEGRVAEGAFCLRLVDSVSKGFRS